MYKSYSNLTDHEKEKINDAGKFELRDVTDDDFIDLNKQKAIRSATLKNIIEVIDKIKDFPSYTMLVDNKGIMHIVYLGTSPNKYQLNELECNLMVFFDMRLKSI